MDISSMLRFPVMDVQLTGAENYTVWALTMQYNLRAFAVWGYVDGTLQCPSVGENKTPTATTSKAPTEITKEDSLTCAKWLQIDSQIMAYIMRSVSVPIRLSIGRLTSSHAQWTALSKMFVQSSAAREYQIYTSLHECRQGERSIQDFYSLMSGYWEELQSMEAPIPPEASTFATTFNRQRDRQRLYQFSMRLRPEFEALRGQLLHRSPLPSLVDALAEFIAEETRLRILIPPTTTEVALAANKTQKSRGGNTGGSQVARDICRYCKKKGHWIAECPTRPPRPGEQGRHKPPIAAVADNPSQESSATLSPTFTSAQLAEIADMLAKSLGVSGITNTESAALSATSGFPYRSQDWDRS